MKTVTISQIVHNSNMGGMECRFNESGVTGVFYIDKMAQVKVGDTMSYKFHGIHQIYYLNGERIKWFNEK
jgi:hypothetical protein